MSDQQVQLYVDELRQTVRVAWLNYEIWWVYKSADTRPKYDETMMKYPLFFQTGIHAHFVALLVALYALYEKRSDTYNIPAFLKLLADAGAVSGAALDEVRTLYQRAQPLWKKVSILRNKAFGHRSRAHTVPEVFQEAGVTPNELRDLVELTRKLLNAATLAWADTAHAFNLSSRKDTLRVLDALQERAAATKKK